MSTACKSPWMVAAVALAIGDPPQADHQGAALTAHTYHTRRREVGLMAVTHNILILRLIKLFYRVLPSPFLAQGWQYPILCWAVEGSGGKVLDPIDRMRPDRIRRGRRPDG